MRIGIDAKWFYSGPVSGTVVLRRLVKELVAQCPNVEWFFFLDKKDEHLGFPYKGNNIHVHYVWAKMNMLSNIFVLPKHIKRIGLDAFFFQTFPAFKISCRSVVLIHDVLFRDYPHYFTWKERLYFVPLRWFMKRADRIIVTTEFVKSQLIKHHYINTSHQVDIVPLAASDIFRPKHLQDQKKLQDVRSKYSLPEKYILFVGRLNVRKNIESLLKAIPELSDSNIKVLIVGKEDWKMPNLGALLSNEKINSRVMILRDVSDDELALIYSLAMIFCYPSFAEGFGIPPLEAMSSGVATIVSNTTSMPDVCGDAALYVDPLNYHTVAQRINELLENEAFRLQLAEKGLARASEFSWAESARKLRPILGLDC